MRHLYLAAVVVCCVAAAPGTRPAPATRDAPATRPADRSTPQAFQRAYRAALNAQDADTARAMFLRRTPGEAAMADVVVANDLDLAKLAAVAGETFGVRLVGGGGTVPPVESDQWRVDNDLATIPDRRGGRSPYAPLRKVDGGYKIDLRAWGMNWLDDADAAEARHRHRPDPAAYEPPLRALAQGRYRTIGEFRDVVGDSPTLATAPDSPAGKPPRAFRRPVKVDLSTPLRTRRTVFLAAAEGDGDAFVRCFQFLDPADEAHLKALARHISSFASVNEAAARKLDTGGAWFGVPAPLPNPRVDALQALLELDQLEHRRPEPGDDPLVINGDEAQWKEMDEVDAELMRVNGEWKLRSRLKAEIGKKDDDPNDWKKIYTLVAQLEEDFTRRIEAGEFRTLKEARDAIDRAARTPPASGPTASGR